LGAILQRIIRHYKEPGIPTDPEVAIGRSFSITRSDWLVQVERIKPGLETADGNDVETSSLPLLGLYFFFFFLKGIVVRYWISWKGIFVKASLCGVLDICGVGYFPRHGVWWCTLT
jgi:hypothetical protein